MLHFIPAWYQQGQWCENEQSWWERRMHTEFDDTMKQIQLFHRNRFYPYQILLLGFAPNLRHFLHRQGVYRAPYWSCFDAIQEVRRKKAAVLSFHNLNWPEFVEFVYNPFVVTAMLGGEKYAQIDFGEDGNPIRIDLYREGRICRRNLYDDRGFVSSTVVYEDAKPLYQDYLTENGTWKLRCFQEDGHVEVNRACPEYLLRYQGKEQRRSFTGLRYDKMEQVIGEVLAAYLSLTERQDIFCIAMHRQHTAVLREALIGKRKILSFFANRYSLDRCYDDLALIKSADHIIADSVDALSKIRSEAEVPADKTEVIAPYDSRIESGISQQLKVQKVLMPVDDLQDEVFEKLVCLLAEYVLENEDIRIHLFTRRAEFEIESRLLEKTRQILEQAGFEPRLAMEEEAGIAENDLDGTAAFCKRFYVEQCVDELSVSKCMREQRLVVDLREGEELYLRISAISFGIPQVVRTASEYVEHGKNGIVLKDMEGLKDTLGFYLDGLQHWNEARVHAYAFVKEHTTDKLLLAWKRVIGCC